MDLKLHGRLAALLGNSFLRDVTKLSFGTVGGRLISLAALPLATRLYDPHDFALLAVYAALVGTIATIACLRLEIAIPLADNDDDASNLLALSLVFLAVIVGVALLLTFSIPGELSRWLGQPDMAQYLWLVPLGIGFAGSYAAFQYWTTRMRRFGRIARTRVGQAAMGVSVMLSLGWAGITPLGLLLGNMLNIGAGGTSLGFQALRHEGERLRAASLNGMRCALTRYRRYPIYSTPEALLNVAGVHVPILLIAAHAGAEAGYLFLAMQIMTVPMTLLGKSISQVYMSRAPEEYRAGTLASFTLSIMRRLVFVGVGPLMLVGALAPFIFPWFFGEAWARAGVIVTWLVPWMALQFIASPVSMVMNVVSWQGYLLIIRTVAFGVRLLSVAIPIYASQIDRVVEFFAVSNASIYFLMALIFLKASRVER